MEERPGELIAWRSSPGTDVESSGTVRFVEAPRDQGTEVHVEVRYSPPAGQLGAAVAKLLGEDPTTKLADDLRRFKQVLETGEVVRSDATPRRARAVAAPEAAPGPAPPAGRFPMRATCWMGRNTVQVENVPDPRILNRRDAIVKITSTAICGSDLHLYDGYVPAMKRGDVLGHEFMGEVVALGPDVGNLKVGDRVVVPFPIACAERAARREALGPSDRRDLLSDIFPTGYMGAELCEIQAGDVVAVWGAGPVGQFAIASAFLLGAERVIAIDRFESRLRMAREHSGAETLNYEQGTSSRWGRW